MAFVHIMLQSYLCLVLANGCFVFGLYKGCFMFSVIKWLFNDKCCQVVVHS